MRRLLLGLLLTLSTALPAVADSDGYFCVGPDYLAVEFRSFNTRGLAGRHVLKILRFEEGRDPRWSGEVVLEDFQTHTLRCYAENIDIEGAGNPRRGWLSYTLEFNLAGAASIAIYERDLSHVFLPADAPPSLGNWARPGIIPLPLENPLRHFQLRVTEISYREARQIRHDKRTMLEEVDDNGRVIWSLLISAGTLYESTGG